ncbi:hypothetical protein EDB87DRAFT_1581963 [Lactarius vividus]|nr:hypothetical protein EDB87DRAFT_1581963 [Lactarius vividus]
MGLGAGCGALTGGLLCLCSWWVIPRLVHSGFLLKLGNVKLIAFGYYNNTIYLLLLYIPGEVAGHVVRTLGHARSSPNFPPVAKRSSLMAWSAWIQIGVQCAGRRVPLHIFVLVPRFHLMTQSAGLGPIAGERGGNAANITRGELGRVHVACTFNSQRLVSRSAYWRWGRSTWGTGAGRWCTWGR